MFTLRMLFTALSVKLKLNCPSTVEWEIIVVYSHNRKLKIMRKIRMNLTNTVVSERSQI